MIERTSCRRSGVEGVSVQLAGDENCDAFATLTGGPPELFWHDVNGFLVDTDPAGLAHGIGSLLADHDHCRAMAANGRRDVEEEYN